MSADSIVDSIGVDIHLHYQNTRYGDFSLVQGLLGDLGVRHTRDGLIDTKWEEYYERHTALGKLGIKCLFITSPSQSSALLKSWPSRVPGAFEGYEAPNEYDRSGDPNWPATLRAFLKRLSDTVKADPRTAHFSVVGPSLTKLDSYAQMEGSEQNFDFANMHNYFGGHNPGTLGWGDGGYGSIVYNIDRARSAWPSKPLMTTETGYITDPAISQGVPASVAGKYVPRMIFEQTLHGVARTYIYELIDEGPAVAGDAGAFGLARMDGSHKPAFTALKNLIATLSDRSTGFLPPNLQFSLVNASNNVHHLLLAKHDGSYYLAFWLEEQDYDVNKHLELPVISEKFTFASNQIFKNPELVTFDANGIIRTVQLASGQRISVTAGNCVSILVLR